MHGSTTYLRRGLLGLVFAGSLGFGATQALATPGQPAAAMAACPDMGYDYYYASCANACPRRQGYCAAGGICRCGQIP
ncbi:MAG TPA: hypothetical protein VGC13_13780 [Longimicrobium sp.]|jgi:hypothetical protein|uniref:hypothetical protein n=1 Tax=Longimicrobium sp. TaxID=2029185 RepID=UPI002EDB5CF5